LQPGLGRYAAARVWEIELMIKLQMTEDEYGDISLKQRARMIAGLKLPQMVEALNQNREYERLKAKQKQHG